MFLKTKLIWASEVFVDFFRKLEIHRFSPHHGLAVSAHKIGGDTPLHPNPFAIHS